MTNLDPYLKRLHIHNVILFCPIHKVYKLSSDTHPFSYRTSPTFPIVSREPLKALQHLRSDLTCLIVYKLPMSCLLQDSRNLKKKKKTQTNSKKKKEGGKKFHIPLVIAERGEALFLFPPLQEVTHGSGPSEKPYLPRPQKAPVGRARWHFRLFPESKLFSAVLHNSARKM